MRALCGMAGLLAASHGLLAAQQSHVVGPGGFPSLQAAYAAAAPGDTILVRVASLPSFTLAGKGVRVIGDFVPTPTFAPTSGFVSTFSDIPFGERLYLENLRFDGALAIERAAAPVVLRRLHIQHTTPDVELDGLSLDFCFEVHVSECFIAGSMQLTCSSHPRAGYGYALSAFQTHLLLEHSTLQAGPAGYNYCYSPPTYRSPYTAVGHYASFLTPWYRLISVDNSIQAPPGGQAFSLSYSYAVVAASPGSIRNEDSELYVYGASGAISGNGRTFANTRPLPRLDASLAGSRLTLSGSRVESRATCFVGVSLATAIIALQPYGQHGAFLVDLDRSVSALFDVIPADAAGAWTRPYDVPPAIAQALANELVTFQFFAPYLDGTVWASSSRMVRF